MVTASAQAHADEQQAENHLLLRMSGISKSFGAIRALKQVDFDLRAGEVHVLAGENGAGKSTLIKILGGVHQPEEGQIHLRGRLLRFHSPREAAAEGVAIIHQELSLVPAMSVADNIFLGHERSAGGWLRYAEQQRGALEALGRLGLDVDVRQTVGTFPIATQQLIEITKALALDADVIVMDEPTSALREPEVERLFDVIGELKQRGCGIIYITHKLEEVYRIADRITVLRDGDHIVTARMTELPADALVRSMVGHDLPESARTVAEAPLSSQTARLAIRDFSVQAARRGLRPLVDRVSFEVRAGEILGLAGLAGSGNSDLLSALFGAQRGRVSGHVRIEGQPYRPTSPRAAIRRGIALVTNDRQRTGLILGMNIAANMTLASVARVSPAGWLNFAHEMQLAERVAGDLDLRAASLTQPVATLSGGNQQKVVLGKWLNAQPRVLLLDEPTRGVDVGAKQEIYQLMNRWSRAGHAIVLITSELPELLMMSDRIIVMHRGKVVAGFDRAEATQERVLHAAMGGAVASSE
ncbi:MAG TPA: sugar ABC transporter ATP-binding protein [Phycisphaerae bacterium]|nr:sugar ABC transporter ATP-binding protein [Phycisphaerae bacterium]